MAFLFLKVTEQRQFYPSTKLSKEIYEKFS